MKRSLALCLCFLLLVSAAAQAKIAFPDKAQRFLDVMDDFLSADITTTTTSEVLGDVTIASHEFKENDHYVAILPDDEDDDNSLYYMVFNYGGPMALWKDVSKEDAAIFFLGIVTAYENLNDGFVGGNFKIWVQFGEEEDGFLINSPELAQAALDALNTAET